MPVSAAKRLTPRVDAKGRPTYFNAAGAAITGYANLDELRAAGKDLHAALQ